MDDASQIFLQTAEPHCPEEMFEGGPDERSAPSQAACVDSPGRRELSCYAHRSLGGTPSPERASAAGTAVARGSGWALALAPCRLRISNSPQGWEEVPRLQEPLPQLSANNHYTLEHSRIRARTKWIKGWSGMRLP